MSAGQERQGIDHSLHIFHCNFGPRSVSKCWGTSQEGGPRNWALKDRLEYLRRCSVEGN